jgi:hypothetical protein
MESKPPGMREILHDPDKRIEQAQLLVFRLERLSVDSYWAHRASGLRGSLLRVLEQLEQEQDEAARAQKFSDLAVLVQKGFKILELGAREIRPPQAL